MEEGGDVGRMVVNEIELGGRVVELGKEITADYAGRPPLLVGVLKGAFVFMSDLSRAIDLPVEFDFMAVSSYGSATRSSGVVRIIKDLDLDLTDRHVLIVEDIVDSGLTLAYLRKNLAARSPASLEVCALLVKEGLQRVDLDLKYVGFRIPPVFVVGYGLDVAERYRNLPYIAEYAGNDATQMLVREGETRPWGRYEVLTEESSYKVKTITVNPGQRLSYQRHRRRSEHWFVVVGTGLVTLDDATRDVAAGSTVDVAVGTAHRIQNTGSGPLIFVEVQRGTYLGEDDIERLSDDYGRAEPADA